MGDERWDSHFLAFLVCQWLKVSLSPIGSPTFVVFLVIWPFASPLVRPGIHSIPLLGDALAVLAPQNNANVSPVIAAAIAVALVVVLLLFL